MQQIIVYHLINFLLVEKLEKNKEYFASAIVVESPQPSAEYSLSQFNLIIIIKHFFVTSL